MINYSEMEKYHIAPCGMNCSLCLAFQRDKNRCSGCNGPDEHKPKSCIACRIRNCDKLIRIESNDFCGCGSKPCLRLKQLDKRYRTRYGMSMLENLKRIKNDGLDQFMADEITKWTCRECSAMLCVHRGICPVCGSPNPWFPDKK